MSRIPPVRRWRVRYHIKPFSPVLFDHLDVHTSTINKRFARWNADDEVRGLPWFKYVTRVTISLAPK